jgi:DnaJ domain
MDDILECYRILDVSPNASLEEVKRAYRELARVWHPDRFPNDIQLQQKAQEKLKQINLAYERICGRGTHQPRRPTTSTTGATPKQAQQNAPPPQWTPPQPQTSQSESAKPKRTSWFWGPAGQPQYSWLIYVALVLAAVVFVSPYLTTPSATRRPQSVSPRKHDIFDELVPSRASVTPPSLAFQPPNWTIVSPTPIEIRRAEPVNEVGVSPTPIEIRRAEPVNEFRRRSPYFTVGSTKDDVLRIQGTPDSFTDEMFRYGGSSIRFKGDRVVSWYNGYPKMKAVLRPSSP